MKNKFKVEFHVHTSFSKDSLLTFPFMLLMCKLRQIDCLVITDHNRISGAKYYKKKLEKYGIKVIVGEEIFSKDGEIIGLYLEKKIQPNLSGEETIDEIIMQGGLVYIPHPFDEKRRETVIDETIIKENEEKIDFIEIHNGRNIKESFSYEQQRIQMKYNIIPIVGSDAHTFFELGRNYCYVDSLDKKELKKSINKQIFSKKKCIKFSHYCTKFVRLIKIMFGGDIHEFFRIINKKFRKSK